MQIIVDAPTIQFHDTLTEVSLPVNARTPLPEKLWFRISGARAVSEEVATGAAALSLIMVAAAHQSSLILKGAIDADLRQALTEKVIPTLEKLNPSLQPFNLEAGSKPPPSSRPDGSATAVSGGVDSFYVLWKERLLDPDSKPLSTIQELTFFNTGNHRESYRLFYSRAIRAQRISESLAIPLTIIDSNLEEFFPAHLSFLKSHTFRNSAAGYLLSDKVGRFLYASTYRAGSINLGPDISTADEVILPALSTKRMCFESAGSEVSRMEKLEAIASNEMALKTLNVCVGADLEGNCSRCWKCQRTMAQLEIMGKLADFREVFDLQWWGRNRRYVWTRLATDSSPLVQELLEAGRLRNFELPKPSTRGRLEVQVDRLTRGKLKVVVGKWRAALKLRSSKGPFPVDRTSVFSLPAAERGQVTI